MFRLTAPVKLAKPGPPLAPILGQQQIKVVDFLSDFNKQTTHLLEGVPIGCRIKKLPGVGKFTLKVCPPSQAVLLYSVVDLSNRLDSISLFKVLYFRTEGNPTPRACKSIFGTMSSCRLQLK